jgi:hypothetical protein
MDLFLGVTVSAPVTWLRARGVLYAENRSAYRHQCLDGVRTALLSDWPVVAALALTVDGPSSQSRRWPYVRAVAALIAANSPVVGLLRGGGPCLTRTEARAIEA